MDITSTKWPKLTSPGMTASNITKTLIGIGYTEKGIESHL